MLAGCFAFFAFRSFSWLLYIDSNQLKIQSVNNLGDLSLHLAYIRTFASDPMSPAQTNPRVMSRPRRRSSPLKISVPAG